MKIFLVLGFATLVANCTCSNQKEVQTNDPFALLPVEDLERMLAQPHIFIDTPSHGLYTNHGRYLGSSGNYVLDGVNGCTAVVIYAVNNTSSEMAVSHFDASSLKAQAQFWQTIIHDHPGLQGSDGTFVTIFYALVDHYYEETLKELTFSKSSLQRDIGTNVHFRFMPYEMTPPSPGGQPSLQIDVASGKMVSEWHGSIMTRF